MVRHEAIRKVLDANQGDIDEQWRS